MPEPVRRGNAARGRVRAYVDYVFAGQKLRIGLIVRTIGMVRAKAWIGLANVVYNIQRLVWTEARGAPG